VRAFAVFNTFVHLFLRRTESRIVKTSYLLLTTLPKVKKKLSSRCILHVVLHLVKNNTHVSLLRFIAYFVMCYFIFLVAFLNFVR